MFYRYEIKNNGKEDILYLYLTMTYEFSKELDQAHPSTKINDKVKNFIQNNSVDFKGNKVYLVVDGIIIQTLNINKEYVVKNIEEQSKYSNDSYIVKVKFPDNHEETMTLNNYLLGVLATNQTKDLELTTLKALCLLYRTYAYKEMRNNKFIQAVNPFQIFKHISYYKVLWLDQYQENFNKIQKAIKDTDGEFITYQDKYINPYIHICNNGFTETLPNIEYLEKRSSLWDYASPYYLEIKDYDYNYLKEIFSVTEEQLKELKVLKINSSNHIEEIQIGNKIYSGEQFRNIINLKSSDITIIINPTFIRFITKGWGNCLGLSQFGANEIAKCNCSYTSIIQYYFPKVTIKKYK